MLETPFTATTTDTKPIHCHVLRLVCYSILANKNGNVNRGNLDSLGFLLFLYRPSLESQTGFKDNDAAPPVVCSSLEERVFRDAQMVQIHLLRLSQLWGHQ